MKRILAIGTGVVLLSTAALCIVAAVVTSGSSSNVAAGDWPRWCGRPDCNMISDATGLASSFDEFSDTNASPAKLKNVKWVTPLGEVTYGSPVVSGGKVFVSGCLRGAGTRSAIGATWCLRESDGKLLWRFRSPYLEGLYNRSWGFTSTPTVEGDRVYLLGHLGEVLCLNANGLANGNTGPFQDEASLLATDWKITKDKIAPDGSRILEHTPGTPGKLEPGDADIIWRFDMIKEVKCWPFNALNAGILIRGDYLYVATCSVLSRGGGDTADDDIEDWKKKTGQTRYLSPNLIVLDKKTGKLLATDDGTIFEETFHGAHSSPSMGTVNGKDLIFLGGGNGWCYAFDPNFEPGSNGKPGLLRQVWKFNCVDPSTYDGPSESKRPSRPVEIISTPVFYRNRVYVAVGNDLLRTGPQAYQGRFVCIDATKTGDITKTAKVWSFEDIRSSSSTVAISNGLLFTADAAGFVYCLDAENGHLYWKFKANPIWASPLVADGKVYVPTYRKGLQVFAASKELKRIYKGIGGFELDSSPAVAGRTLYIASTKHLYAVESRAMTRKMLFSIIGASSLLAIMVLFAVARLVEQRKHKAS